MSKEEFAFFILLWCSSFHGVLEKVKNLVVVAAAN